MLGRRFGMRLVRFRPQWRSYFVTTVNDRITAATFSSWQYDVPWRRINEEDIEKAKRLVMLQKQRDELIKSVQMAVRAHLQAEFPKAFSLTSSQSIWKNFRTKELNDKAHTLLELNGFEKVPLPDSMDMLMLAEGVVAFPNFYSRIRRSNEQNKFLLFAQPETDSLPTETEIDAKYPVIVQEDIRLYRVLENQAERIIDTIYDAVVNCLNLFIQKPIERLTQQIQSKIDWVRSKLFAHVEISGIKKAPIPNIRLPSMVHHSEIERFESLLVLGEDRDEMKLYAHMSPSVRLVALPYTLGHKSASTLVSVSLVLFGAMPLAYRSLNYAFLYPGLSEALAVSVIGTISYGIWSQRYNARVSQSQVVANALLHRLQARDDAVVLLLQEGAVRHVSQAVLGEYFDRLDKKAIVKQVYGMEQKVIDSLVKAPKVSLASTDLVDPMDLAIKLGLLNQDDKVKSTDIGGGQDKNAKFHAVSLEEAASTVQSRRM